MMKKNSIHYAFSAFVRKLSLMICFLGISAFAVAQSKVTGTVKDQAGQPVIGASVVVEGTTTGTTTGVDGTFSLAVRANDLLSISYVGYKSELIPVAGKTNIEVTMQEDAAQLEDVVVIGYGTVKKKDLTGSVVSVKQEDIVAIPTSNVLESLQGKVAGMDMTKTSGQAGAGVSYTIRGNRSLNASNAPLVLVDGVPYGDMDINPNIIESIDVLKDASSTAIYGSRGANGVILITTKQGKGEKTQVSYNGYISFDSKWGYPDMQNTAEYGQYIIEAYRSTGEWKSEADNERLIHFYEFYKDNISVDWVDLVTRSGYTTSHSVNVARGGDKTRFNASLQYQDQKGIIYNDDMRRYSGTLSLSHNITDNLIVDASTIITYTDLNRGQDPFNAAVKNGPHGYPYNEDGSINIYPYNDSQTINPMVEQMPGNYENNTRKTHIFASAGLTWKPVKGLTLKSSFNTNLSNSRQGKYFGVYTISQQNVGKSKAAVDHSEGRSLQWETTANYELNFNEKHSISVLAGMELSQGINESYHAEGLDLLSPSMLYHNLESCQEQIQASSQYTKTSMASFFGRLNYKFDERFLVTATLRYDGASQLAEGQKWEYFPSVAGAWRINEEEFMKSTRNWLDNLKLRLSWGVSGNSAVEAYATGGGLGKTMYVFDVAGVEKGQYGYWPKAMPNNSLTWEKTATTNVGLDMSFLKNRINATVDWYIQKTSDLLMQRQVPITTGYMSTWANVGKTENRGIEVTLNTRNIVHKNFTWTTDVTFTRNREEIVELADGLQRDEVNGWFVGHPIDVHYAVKKIGIWQLDETEEAAKYNCQPGSVKNVDTDGNFKIDAADRQIIGTERPDFVMGMTNRFKYKNVDLSIFLYWRHGNMINLQNSWTIDASRRAFSYVNYWTPENPTNDYPRPIKGRSGNDIEYSGLCYYDGSFLKIRDITLGYTFPNSWMKKVHMRDARVYCTLKNFFSFDNLPCDGYDPERMGGQGWPTIKQLVFGLNVNF